LQIYSVLGREVPTMCSSWSTFTATRISNPYNIGSVWIVDCGSRYILYKCGRKRYSHTDLTKNYVFSISQVLVHMLVLKLCIFYRPSTSTQIM
jgi:hypothetical protein